jgi:hypothetical protein
MMIAAFGTRDRDRRADTRNARRSPTLSEPNEKKRIAGSGR